MAGLKQLKRRLQSVRNTKKITYAMKLVAAAKLRKVQNEVVSFRRYNKYLLETATLFQSNDGFAFPDYLTEKREVSNICLVVIGGFRGLAGGYNANVAKAIDSSFKSLNSYYPKANIESIVFGKKAVDHFRKQKKLVKRAYEKLPDSVNKWPIDNEIVNIIERFKQKEIDKVVVLYTEFWSALSQQVKLEELLPILPKDIVEKCSRFGVEVSLNTERKLISEPSPIEVFEQISSRIVRATFFYAAMNSVASEHGSRMTAMDSATKNAGDLIDKLRLTYNKVRQTGITAELLDIIGGAEAVR
jgi:F-type H+-transporting ATPase subunit gamma